MTDGEETEKVRGEPQGREFWRRGRIESDGWAKRKTEKPERVTAKNLVKD